MVKLKGSYCEKNLLKYYKANVLPATNYFSKLLSGEIIPYYERLEPFKNNTVELYDTILAKLHEVTHSGLMLEDNDYLEKLVLGITNEKQQFIKDIDDYIRKLKIHRQELHEGPSISGDTPDDKYRKFLTMFFSSSKLFGQDVADVILNLPSPYS